MLEFWKKLQTNSANFVYYATVSLIVLSSFFSVKRKIAQQNYISKLEKEIYRKNSQLRIKQVYLKKDNFYLRLNPKDLKAIDSLSKTKNFIEVLNIE